MADFCHASGRSAPNRQIRVVGFPSSMAISCEDGHIPLGRYHHKCKQSDGWTLEQMEPGVLAWHAPAGRTYTTTPIQYAT